MSDLEAYKQQEFTWELSNKALNPDYFQPDERSFSDLLTFLNRLSRKMQYYDLNNKAQGDWYDFFVSDEIFLLAEIESFPLADMEKKRINAMIAFENQNAVGEKQKIIRQFYSNIFNLLHKLNEWYSISSRFNRNIEGTPIENELASVIEFTGLPSLRRLRGIYQGTVDDQGQPFFVFDDTVFLSIWNNALTVDPENLLADKNKDALALALKHLLLIYKPIYKTVSTLVVRARSFLQQSLEKSSHQPHIGLILTFLELYKLPQQELNLIPERQLSFYLDRVLQQKKRSRIPDRMYIVFDIDSDRKSVLLPAGTTILAGQNEEGEDRLYITERDTILNHARIASLHTLFVARNPLIDQNSRFQLVSGIYQQPLHPDGKKTGSWATLGEEQRFMPPEERTMADADIGFALVSNVLKLQSGQREILVTFHFTERSFHFLTTVLMDIAARRQIKAEEAFYTVFANSIIPEYTGPEGWVTFNHVDLLAPAEWDLRKFSVRLILSPGMPPVVPYEEELHLAGWEKDQPIIRIMLRGSNSYHPYSHLHFLELDEISIDVSVAELRDFTLISTTGAVDDAGPFELLGSSPKKGSYLLIGNDELFSKRLTQLQAGWDYFGLPADEEGLSGYYAAYPYPMSNQDFTVRLSALSDFTFKPKKAEPAQRLNLFEFDDPNGPVKDSRFIQDIDLSLLKIRPQPKLKRDDVEVFHPRMETGFLKMELETPDVGFGFDVYTSVYNASISQSSDVKLSRNSGPLQVQTPNDPFSPVAENFYLNYKASSRLIFNGQRSFENDTVDRNTFIHIHPFGSHETFTEGAASQRGLVPYFHMEGAIYLGIEDATANDVVSMLWELVPNEKWTYGKGADVNWHYLSKNEWIPLKEQYLLFDETNGLINSGIISIELPPDINTDNNSMQKGLVWLRAGAPAKAELVSRLKGIHCRAASAGYQLPEIADPTHPVSLPAFSAEAIVDDIPGIVSVLQPLASVNGRAEESQGEFVSRVSEYLRHKQRSITTWDMEKMMLREFNQLTHVRAFGHFGYEEHVAPGEVIIVALPKIHSDQVFFQPRLDPGEIHQMEEYLRKISSPFSKITIRNPLYEFMWVKCKVVLNSKEVGTTLKQLHQDLLRFICPWFYEDPKQAMTVSSIKRSDVFMYLQSRPYVSYITGFSLVHLTVNDHGQYQLQDTANTDNPSDEVICTAPWSLLIPLTGNQIEIIRDAEYVAPEPTTIEEMIIGTNLVIGEGFSLKPQQEAIKDLIPPEDKPQPSTFSFTLKF